MRQEGRARRPPGSLSARRETPKLGDVTRPTATPAERRPHYPGPCRPAPASHRRSGGAAIIVAITLLLVACGRDGVRPAMPARASTGAAQTVSPADPASANAVLMRSLSLVGTPYRYGGITPADGFDCSGFVGYVFRDTLDVRLPRTTQELAAWQGPRIPRDRLATADLVFFGTGRKVSHVGIYVGEGRFVHAPGTGDSVRMDRLDGSYWRDRYWGAVRILP